MRRVLGVIDRAVGLLALVATGLSAALLLASLALVSYSVGMRYFLNRPIPWVDELVGYLLVGIVMLAAADALRRGEHIAVDVLTTRLGPRMARAIEALGQVAVFLVGAALLYGGLQTVAFTQMLGIRSTGYLSVPMHIPQMLIPFGGALLALAALGGLLRMAMGLPSAVEAGGAHGAPSAITEPEERR
ncbi:TRAP transporter small permease [Salinarimonas sp.]|uniref:TRAP transporter small permease n=1 Tax=Salinarimonas sp. TaxID=2766526 RepID=UPI00391CDE6E